MAAQFSTEVIKDRSSGATAADEVGYSRDDSGDSAFRVFLRAALFSRPRPVAGEFVLADEADNFGELGVGVEAVEFVLVAHKGVEDAVVVEALGKVSSHFQVLLLILSNRNIFGPVNHDIGGL